MGGFTARIAAVAALPLAGLALGAPAPAAADSPLASAPAVSSPAVTDVGAPIAAAVQAVVDSHTPTTVRETAEQTAVPAPKGQPTATSPSVAHTLPRRQPAAERQDAAARNPGAARVHENRAAKTTSPPHGPKAKPPARSHEERAAGASAPDRPGTTAPDTPREPFNLPGLTGAAGTPFSVGAGLLAAFLMTALFVALPFVLSRFDLAAPVSWRPAYVSPLELPG